MNSNNLFVKGLWPTHAAILLVVLSALTIDLNLQNWKEQRRVIEHDVHAYYGYLPALFIYNDITLTKSDYRSVGEDGRDYYKFWPNHTPDGRKVMKMSMGLSVLYAPFFFAAHGYALLDNAYLADGFSEPYKFMLLISALAYLWLGLLVLRRILLTLGYSNAVVALTLLLIGLGTNLLAYASQSAPNVHVYNFFVFALFISATLKWYANPSMRYSIAVGLLAGFIALIRPSNAIIVLLLLLYGINSHRHLMPRVRLWLSHWRLLLVIILLAAAVWIPQVLYWKAATGQWMYYSYNDERFFFNNPRIIDGLFSWRKGWLLYTPMMAFALAGIFFLRGAAAQWRSAIVVFMAVNIYVIFSWWCWWYGGTFGQRSLIESYALLAIPLAAFMAMLLRQKSVWQVSFAAVALFFIWLNIFQTYQFEYESLHYDGMSKELYLKQFGKMDKIEGFDQYIDWTDADAAKQGKSEKYKK